MTAIAYTAPPTLAAFGRSNAFVRGAVGPLGSGKSSMCVVEVLRRAVEQRPGPDNVRRTRFVVIRNTYPELRDTTRKTFEQWIPPSLGRWHEQSFTFTMDEPLADGTRVHMEVLFRALDSPDDVKKLLSLELTGAYINEARQIPKAILDGLTGRVGRYPSKAQGGASWFGIWLDTNPWHVGHWGYKLFSQERPEGFELFEQPGGRDPDAENIENLPAGYYERLCAGKDAEWIAEYVDGKYPAHDKGSIYGDLLAALEARGGLLAFEHPTDDLFTVWDLGRADSTAVWFFRFGARSLEAVDFYENHGQALSHYFGVLKARQEAHGYRYTRHYLPHDARAKTLSTQASILDQFLSQYGAGAVEIVPSLSVADGIAAARALLEGPVRIHPRCDTPPLPGLSSGLEALRAYKYAWDDAAKVFSRTPVHDWSSHAADGWRYLALVANRAESLARSRRPLPPAEPMRPAGTLNEHKRFQPPQQRRERIG